MASDIPNATAMEFNLVRWLCSRPIIGDADHPTKHATGLGLAMSLRDASAINTSTPNSAGPAKLFGLVVVTFLDSCYTTTMAQIDVDCGILVSAGHEISTQTLGPAAYREHRIRHAHKDVNQIAMAFQFIGKGPVAQELRVDVCMDVLVLVKNMSRLIHRLTTKSAHASVATELPSCDQWSTHHQALLQTDCPQLAMAFSNIQVLMSDIGTANNKGHSHDQTTYVADVASCIDRLLDAYLVGKYEDEYLHQVVQQSLCFIGSAHETTIAHDGVTVLDAHATPFTDQVCSRICNLHAVAPTHWPLSMSHTPGVSPDVSTVARAIVAGLPALGDDKHPDVEIVCFSARTSLLASPHSNDDVETRVIIAGCWQENEHVLNITAIFPGALVHLQPPHESKENDQKDMSESGVATTTDLLQYAHVLGRSMRTWCTYHAITSIVVWRLPCSSDAHEDWTFRWWQNCMSMTACDRSPRTKRITNTCLPWFEAKLT